MRNKSFGYASVMAAITLFAMPTLLQAKPLTPDQAAEGAVEFISASLDGVPSRRAPGNNMNPVIAYTSRSNQLNCYYVVNIGNGFVIMSADDRLPAVLGYSDNGNFDTDKIPDNMRWWLESYKEEIAHWLPNAPESNQTNALSQSMRATRETIEPLMSTMWNQDAPFNNECPIDSRYNVRCPSGCVATAMSQIMKFHEWPLSPTGSNAGVIFNGTTYEWGNMIDYYAPGRYNAAQGAAVAKLMRQVGASVDMQYAAYGSGAYDFSVQLALRTYFDYASDLQMHWRDYTSYKDWVALVYSELADNRPVYYSGSSSQGGHAFVCDGYSSNDYFHFNWGWGGYQDGYFRLTALNPESGGLGSYEGGYNTRQSILTGIRKNDGTSEIQYALLSTGSFYYDSGIFTTTDSTMEGYDLFYNPLGITENIYLGLKIVNMDTPQADPVYVRCGDKVELPENYGITEFNGSIPTLEDGKYRVYGVFSTDGSKWRDILIPIGKQNFVSLSVTNGKNNFTNDGNDVDMTPHLIMGRPQTTSILPASGEKYFRIPFVNTNAGDFLGEIGISLFGEDEFGDVISSNLNVAIPGESATYLEVISADPVAPGDYTMYVIDADGNTISDEYVYTFTDENFAQPAADYIMASELSPNFNVGNDDRVLYATLINRSSSNVSTRIIYTFENIKTGEKSQLATDGKITLEAHETQRFGCGPMNLDLNPGEYFWYLSDENDKVISNRAVLIVESDIKQAGKLSYVVTEESTKSAVIVAPENMPYTGDIVIPENIDGYTITGIRQDAFTFSTCRLVNLPASVSYLENGAFFNDNELRVLELEYNGIVEKESETFGPSAEKYVWVSVPDDVANTVSRSSEWQDFLFPAWFIDYDSNKITLSELQIDPQTSMPYQPYCISNKTQLSFGAQAESGKVVTYATFINNEWCYYDDESNFMNLTLPKLGNNVARVKVDGNLPGSSVAAIQDNEFRYDVYSIDGRAIMIAGDAYQLDNLESGLYIINGKKVMIRK